MRLTTKGRYALRAMLRLASNDPGGSMPLREIAEAEEISVQYLNQLFFLLRKAGLVKSRRGPKGGFLLGRDPDQITIKDILDVVGEGYGVAVSDDEEQESPETGGHTAGDGLWMGAAATVESYFATITLAKILTDRESGKQTAIL